MTYRVLLQNKPADGYIATTFAWPNCVVEAPTREEALVGIRTAIAALLVESEIVEVDVPTSQPVITSAYATTFGMFRSDPTFTDFMQEVAAYRSQRNQLSEE